MPVNRTLLIGAIVAISITGGAYLSLAKHAEVAAVSKSWPSPFNTLAIGATESEVAATAGNPARKADNPLYENKSANEWSRIEAEVDDLSRKDSDPYASLSPADHAKYVELSRSLEHQVKTVWTYPRAGSEDKVAVSFDGSGKLLRVDIQKPVHTGGPGVRPSTSRK